MSRETDPNRDAWQPFELEDDTVGPAQTKLFAEFRREMERDRISAQRPNLFGFATSELTQDAFLCWLLAWADSSHQESPLYPIAVSFVTALFQAAGGTPPATPFRISVRRQVDHVDIVALVGEHDVLVIEDKVHAGDQNHFAGYIHAISGRYASRLNGRRPAAVYLKTGDQSSYERVLGAGWATMTRLDLLRVLRTGAGVRSDIFRDFLVHLETMEEEIRRFRAVPIRQFHLLDRAWTGLYVELQARLRRPDVPGPWWSQVPNARRGFMYFGWAGTFVDGIEIRPSLESRAVIESGEERADGENSSLVIKICVDDPTRQSALRHVWMRRLVGTHEGHVFRRPDRLGKGRWMTVAVLDGLYYSTHPTGVVDVDDTARRLGDIAAVVRRIVDTHRTATAP